LNNLHTCTSRGRGRGRGGRGAVRAGESFTDSSIPDTQKDGNGNGNGNGNGIEDWMETGEEEEEKNKANTLALMNGQSGGDS
jgi:hypothetical protein